MPMRASRTYVSFIELTDPAKHHEYNEWHQLDHRPENFNLPGIVYGERFVLTPDCQAASFFAEPQISPFHYLLMYWMEEPLDRTWRDFQTFSTNSIAMGRRPELGYVKRRLSSMFIPLKGYAAPRISISPEAVPFRPAKGIYVTATDFDSLEGIETQEMLRWYDQVYIPEMITCRGIAGVWTFVSDAGYSFSNSVVPVRPGRILQVYYLDDEPLRVWDEMNARTAKWRTGARPVTDKTTRKDLFAGPLEVIQPWRWEWFNPKSMAR
jgi:hypothetical protein